MTAWKVAESLEVLRLQLNALAPNRSTASDGSIGDAAHASRDSDHNPWWVFLGQAYVTARDFTHDPAGGLDGAWLAARLQLHRDQRIKYVIFRRRIMSGSGGWSPWTWRPYSGTNPHDHHLHLSVVPDARALARIAWRLDEPTGPLPIPPAATQEVPDLTPEQDKMLRVVHSELTKRLDNRRGEQGATIPGGGADTVLGYAANADGAGYRASWTLADIQGDLDGLRAMVIALTERQGAIAVTPDQLAAALLRQIASAPKGP